MANAHSYDLVSAFVIALRRVISTEPDRSAQLAKLAELRRQLSMLLRIAPYDGDRENEPASRVELAAAMEAAYIEIIAEDVPSAATVQHTDSTWARSLAEPLLDPGARRLH